MANETAHESSDRERAESREARAAKLEKDLPLGISTPIEVDVETNRRLLRKIDWRLMPVVSSE